MPIKERTCLLGNSSVWGPIPEMKIDPINPDRCGGDPVCSAGGTIRAGGNALPILVKSKVKPVPSKDLVDSLNKEGLQITWIF